MNEEHEEIPWSMLVDRDRSGRARTWYAAAGVLLVIAVGFTGVRWIEGHRHGESAPPSPEPVTTTTLPITSEQELRRSDDGRVLAAVARAEWFVTDYFTIDGSPPADLAAAFADDAVLPELPHHAEDDRVSFVEWTRAYRVDAQPGGLVVTVLFRTLHRDEAGVFSRSAVRAAEIVVLVDGAATAIAGLPGAVEPPVEHGISGWRTGQMITVADPAGIGIPMALTEGR